MIEVNENGAYGIPQKWIDAVNSVLPETDEDMCWLLEGLLRHQGVPPELATVRVHHTPPDRARYSLEDISPQSAEEERLMLDILFLAISNPENGLEDFERIQIRPSLERRLEEFTDNRPVTYPCTRHLFFGT